MNAQLKSLLEERDTLRTMSFKTLDHTMPFTVQIDGMAVPDSIASRARFGITSYIAMRLRELEAIIAELKKEQNA